MKKAIPLKYECLDRFEEVYKICTDEVVKKLLLDLKDLIYYQMEQIRDQRSEIIAEKHKRAWNHYDRPIEEYNTEQRKYMDKT
jgi:hypothetical protein